LKEAWAEVELVSAADGAAVRAPAALRDEAPLALPRLDASQVAWNNHLLGAVACSDVAGDPPAQWRWCLPRAAAPEHTLTLTAGELSCRLAIDGDSGAFADGSIDLHAFEADALCMAAVVRYARLLAHLQRLSRTPWVCASVVRGAAVDDGAGFAAGEWAIGFEVAVEGVEGSTLSGRLAMNPPADCWMSVVGRAAALAPAAAHSLGTVPVGIDVFLPDVPPFSRAEVAAIRPGAALLLSRSGASVGHACRLRLRGTNLEAQASWRPPASVAVHSAWSQRLHSNSSPREAPAMETVNPAATTDAVTAVDDLPVLLEFRIGQLAVPMNEVAAKLAPGVVIDLEQPVAADTVTITVHGRTLAHGQLVMVGDMLAVKVTRLEGHGSH
jgi:flagellar motor switch/type III secretory pathway protein FliN